ncbi:hypothetical protein VM1G_01891 [Cytospora mali]|uniref:Uncharacterized protein n=1 Tax=Cytospora mali TaxID=578113 RepID=A0A194VRY6_CYTMA|nr:hypothetical protein VM1G_01891 [Valsa mali]
MKAYILAVLRNPDVCLDRSKEGCSAAWAFTVFEAIWVFVEAISFGVLIARYIGRDTSFERPDRKGEWKTWLRGAQVICAGLSVTLAVLLYLPTGIPVVDEVRSPKIVWLLLLGAIICGIFWPWYFAMCFPCIRRSMYRSYCLYNFYVAMECLALAAYLSLGAVYALKFLTKGSACANITQQGCLAILATDVFTSIAGTMQIVQVIALMFLLHKRPPKPIKFKKPKKPKKSKQPKQPRQRYQSPKKNAYMYANESYPELQPPPPSYKSNEKHWDMELEEARDLDRLQNKQWKRDTQRLRAQAKARYDAEQRARKRQQEVMNFENRRLEREEELNRLKDQARAREKHLQQLKEELWEQEVSLEHEDYSRGRENKIANLQAKIREQDDKLSRVKERQRQMGPGRRKPHEMLPPPPLESVLQAPGGQRSGASIGGRRQDSDERVPPLLAHVRKERNKIDERQQHRAKLYD